MQFGTLRKSKFKSMGDNSNFFGQNLYNSNSYYLK